MAGVMRSKPILPKSILDMKFMKRTKDRLEKEKRVTEAPLAANAATFVDEHLQVSGNFIIENSYLVCDNLMNGRLSFNGMNPEIERMMELEQVLPVQDTEKDISDEQLSKKFKAFKRNRDFSDRDNGDGHVPMKRIKRERI